MLAIAIRVSIVYNVRELETISSVLVQSVGRVISVIQVDISSFIISLHVLCLDNDVIPALHIDIFRAGNRWCRIAKCESHLG